MDDTPRRETPADILDALRAHPEWTDRERDDALDRLVERFPVDVLVEAIPERLRDLSGGDAETVLRLIEAHPRPHLLTALAEAVAAQPGLALERAWDAMAVLDGAGALEGRPALAERWDELNEAGSVEELVEQIEADPEGVWLALQGLVAVEPEVRLEIVAGLARVPLGPGLVEFLRLLSYCHDEPTRAAALDALSADPGRGPALREAWLDLATHHPSAAVVESARRRLGTVGPRELAVGARSDPAVVRTLVTAVDGRGRGRIVLTAAHDGRRATAVFVCDVDQGVVDLVGEVEPDSTGADATFEEIAAGINGDVVEGATVLARGLLGGSLLLSGPSAPPSLRFWVESTIGRIAPSPIHAGFPDSNAEALTLAETAERALAVLDACPDWLDESALTYELAEEVLLRERDAAPDPKRDAGAFRFLFEHRLKGRLETYRRMLLWMSGFWQAGGDEGRARAAFELASQLSDEQHVVPGHPFTVALTTRSLAAAQEALRRGDDPRRRGPR